MGLVMLLAVLTAGLTWASGTLQAATCDVPAGQVVEGDLYVLCQEFTLAGRVNGSVFGAVLNATITGEVADDLYLVARNVTVSGALGEDLVAVAGAIALEDGTVWEEGDLIAAVASARLAPQVRVPGSVTMLAYQLRAEGAIDGALLFLGESLGVGGQVGGAVNARTGGLQPEANSPVVGLMLNVLLNVQQAVPGLRVGQSASIGGDLIYVSPTEAEVLGDVSGQTAYTQEVIPPTLEEFVAEDSRIDALRAYFGQVVQDVLVLGLVGAVLLWLWPKGMLRPIEAANENPLGSGLVGLGMVILSVPTLILVLVLGVAVVLMIAAFARVDGLMVVFGSATGLLTLGGGGLFYFVTVYVARAVTASVLGSLLITRITQADLSRRQRALSVLVGAGIIAAVGSIYPFGWVVNLASAAFGVGAIWRALHKALNPPVQPPAPQPARALAASSAPMSPNVPPPLSDMPSAPRGMENLPNGFRWWDEE
jgi:hypothetical protein